MVKFSSQQKDLLELRQHRAIEAGEQFLVVGLEDNLQWVESELAEFFNLLGKGVEYEEIAIILSRPLHEVYYLLAYLNASCRHRAVQSITKQARKIYRRKHSLVQGGTQHDRCTTDYAAQQGNRRKTDRLPNTGT